MNDSVSTSLTDETRGHPTHEEISSRAQQVWEKLGRPSDRDEEIWLQAERELRSEAAATPQPNQPAMSEPSALIDIQALPPKTARSPRKAAVSRSGKSAAR